MPQSPPAKPWLHPGLAVRSSPIEGQGLFAIEPLPEDTRVVVFGGRLITDAELAALFAVSTAYIDTLSIDRDLNLVLTGRTAVGYGNHSCDPTLWWSGAFSLSTRRPLQVGDEATLDYATITDAADYALDCACATTLCRGQVTGLDWQLLALQYRYHQHWVPALQKRIEGA